MKGPSKTRKFRIVFVVSATLFILLILLLVKVLPENRFVALLFVVGWLIFAGFVIEFIRRYNWKD